MISRAKKYVAVLLVFVCVCMIFSPQTAYAAEDSSQHETVDCRGVMETLVTMYPHGDFRAVGLRYGDRTRISLYGFGVLRHAQQQAQAHQKLLENFHVVIFL